jgi:hypothetical protein
MPELNLTQAEADLLIAIEKHCVDDTEYEHPSLGGPLCVPLVSADRRENFFLDISRSRIDFAKGKYQERARNVVVLVRLDFGGQPHRNPDGAEVASPHLHLYKEGFADKWAYPVPKDRFPDTADLAQSLDDFMSYCNITRPPRINRGLFA